MIIIGYNNIIRYGKLDKYYILGYNDVYCRLNNIIDNKTQFNSILYLYVEGFVNLGLIDSLSRTKRITFDIFNKRCSRIYRECTVLGYENLGYCKSGYPSILIKFEYGKLQSYHSRF